MKSKIIKTKQEYEASLLRLEVLMDKKLSKEESDELELLSILIEMYEDEKYRINLPDPIEAIKFRMEQSNLKQKDLIPFIGSGSKVSEVLNRKRPLSLKMIRSLNKGLGIPAEVLIQRVGESVPESKFEINAFPFNEMFKRNYFEGFNGTLARAKEYYEELLDDLFSNTRSDKFAYYKHAEKKSNEFALAAWRARLIKLADKENIAKYNSKNITDDFLSDITKLSYFKRGPELVKEMLNKHGIHFVILKHLPKTYFDGAVLFSNKKKPIIGLTLRYNRLDNFWFTLLHELAHVKEHLKKESDFIVDNLEEVSADKIEIEANKLAKDSLIKPENWIKYKNIFYGRKNTAAVLRLANELKISPAIIAGRIRRMKDNYTIYSELLKEDVRNFFPEWN